MNDSLASSTTASEESLGGVPARSILWLWLFLALILARPPESNPLIYLLAVGALSLSAFSLRPSQVELKLTLGMLAVLYAHVLISPIPALAFESTIPWLVAVLVYFVVKGLSDPEREKLCLWAGILIIVIAVWAILQKLFIFEALLTDLGPAEAGDEAGAAIRERLRSGRVIGSFATPAAWGLVAAMGLPLIYQAMRKFQGSKKVALGFGLGVLLIAGALSLSFSAVIAAIATSILMAFGIKAWRRKLWIALPLAALLIVVFVVVRDVSLWGTPEDPSPLRMRSQNVRVALEMTQTEPYLGLGLGGYGEAYAAYRQSGDNESRHAHMWVAEWLAEGGIAGGVASLMLLFWFIWPALRGSHQHRWQFAAAWASAAFAFHNLLDFTVFLPSILWLAVLLRATLCKELSKSNTASRLLWGCFALLVFWAAAAQGVGKFIEERVELKLANEQWEEALHGATLGLRFTPWNLDLMQFKTIAEIQQLNGTEVTPTLNELARNAPWRAAVSTWEAGEAERRNDPVDAWLHWERAVQLSPLLNSARERRDAYRTRWLEAASP